MNDYSHYNTDVEERTNRGGRNWLAWVIGAAAVVTIALIEIPYLAGQINDTAPNGADTQPTQEPQGGGPGTDDPNTVQEVTIEDIRNNPENYVGRSVIVSGEVDDFLSNRVFRLDQEGRIIGDEIIILSRNAIYNGASENENNPFSEAEEIMVEGTVRIFTPGETENDLGVNLGLEDDVLNDFRDEPVIVANRIIAIPQEQ